MKALIFWIIAAIIALVWAAGWFTAGVSATCWLWSGFTDGNFIGKAIYSEFAIRLVQTLLSWVVFVFFGALLPMAVYECMPGVSSEVKG